MKADIDGSGRRFQVRRASKCFECTKANAGDDVLATNAPLLTTISDGLQSCAIMLYMCRSNATGGCLMSRQCKIESMAPLNHRRNAKKKCQIWKTPDRYVRAKSLSKCKCRSHHVDGLTKRVLKAPTSLPNGDSMALGREWVTHLRMLSSPLLNIGTESSPARACLFCDFGVL